MKHLFISMTIVFSFVSFSLASIIYIPADQPTIQAGINAAVNGDTVLVADSTYYENINFKGKAITVASHFLMDGDTNHISNTIIDGSQPSNPDSGSVVYFISGEDTNSVLCGFTITGGSGTYGVYPQSTGWSGGGIMCDKSGAKIIYNIIENNNNTHTSPNDHAWGGGLDAWCDTLNFTIVIENNMIRNNLVQANMGVTGGGMSLMMYDDSKIRNNKIINNSCVSNADLSWGGGIHYEAREENPKSLTIVGNFIVGNEVIGNAPSGQGAVGGGISAFAANADITNNIINNNRVSATDNCYGSGIWVVHGDSSKVRDNIISGNYFSNGECRGGGIYLSHNRGSIYNNQISDNVASYGGGVRLYGAESSGSLIKQNFISGNTVDQQGGGIQCYISMPVIENNFIHHNIARDGAGLAFQSCMDNLEKLNGDPQFEEIGGNSRGRFGTPAEYSEKLGDDILPDQMQNDIVQIINNTISYNTATSLGGGIGLLSSDVLVMNSVLWGNSATNGNQIYKSGGHLDVVYSDIEGGFTGSYNINQDPLFSSGCQLSNSSPCLGKGIDAWQLGNTWYYAPPDDIDGDPRPMPAYTMPDIGADENPLGPSNILYVPQQYATIQAGIDAAENTDTVLVADGLYYENINFKGKAITVASTFLIDQDTSHISNTIINGAFPVDPDSGSVVYFISGEDTNSVLCGFTVTGGSGTFNQLWGERVGGGICITGAGGQVVKNKICNNSIDYNLIFGVGICVETTGNYYVIIEDNIIESNAGLVQSASYCNGGGIAAWVPDGGVRIKNNLIRNNTLTSRPYQSDLKGGGIQISCDSPFQSGDAIIEGNTIANNIISPVYLDPLTKGAGINIRNVKVRLFNNRIFNNSFDDHLGYGGGIYVKTSQSSIVNNIIYKNSALNGGGIFIEGLAESESTENKLREGREYSGQALSLNPRNKTEIYQEFYSENYQNLDQPIIINNTITQNFAQSQGGGMYSIHTTPLIMNTLFWRDSAAYFADEFYIYPGDTLNIGHSNFDSSEVYGYWRGPANLHEDPLLEDTVQFHLSGSSPCIDTGIDTLEIVPGIWLYCPCNDIEGNPRPSPPNSMPDMGAWELQFSTIGYPSSSEVLRSYKLYQNYPNPFNPTTTIAFDLRNSSNVKLIIYNILGEAVNTLLSASLLSGFYEYEWDASGLASGVYLYRLQAGDYVETRKMVVMK